MNCSSSTLKSNGNISNSSSAIKHQTKTLHEMFKDAGGKCHISDGLSKADIGTVFLPTIYAIAEYKNHLKYLIDKGLLNKSEIKAELKKIKLEAKHEVLQENRQPLLDFSDNTDSGRYHAQKLYS